MAQFIKKPLTIEAVKFTGSFDAEGKPQFEGEDSPGWVDAALEKGAGAREPGGMWKQYLGGAVEGVQLLVHTGEGIKPLKRNWWLIRGPGGDIYPCKPEIFDETYQAIG